MKHSKWGLRLNHDVTTPDRSAPTLKFLKIDSSRLRGVSAYAHPQHIKVLKHLYTYDMDVGCSLRGFGGLYNSQNSKNTDQKPIY